MASALNPGVDKGNSDRYHPRMSHGPNLFRAERRKAETPAQRAAADPSAIARAQRIVAAWNDRARRGRPAEFFPTFETVLMAGSVRLTYCCPACRQTESIDIRDLADAHHPRAPISMMIPKLSCDRCCPNPPLAVLIELGGVGDPPPTIEREPDEPRRWGVRAEQAPAVPTMEDLPTHGVTELAVWCGKWPHLCDYQGKVTLSAIDLRQTIVDFASNFLCPKCGTIGGQAIPRWPNGGGGPGGAHSHSLAPSSDKVDDAPAAVPGRKRRSRKAR